MLVGAAMAGVVTAVAGKIVRLVMAEGPALARYGNQLSQSEDNGVVRAQFWQPQHAQRSDLGGIELLWRPQFDWGRRRARISHSTHVRNLDSNWEHLKEDGLLWEKVRLETDAADLYFVRSEIEMLADDPDRDDYVKCQPHIDERPEPEAPRGPAPAERHERIKAWLLIQATLYPDQIREMLIAENERALSMFMLDQNPDLEKRHCDKFARILIEEWQTHLTECPPS